MTNRHDPLEGIERLLLDGTNLLHAMRRGSGGPAPATALIGRLRAAIPGTVRIELVFDGPPDPGSRNVRVASGVTVRYSGRISADALLVRLAIEAAPFVGDPATILVVTDDRALGVELRRRGAATVSTAWLLGRLGRQEPGGASIGRGRPPVVPAGSGIGAGGPAPAGRDDDEASDRPGWRPGRGATAKRGNPKRSPRARRPGA